MAKSAGAWISDIMRRSGVNEIGSSITRGQETRVAIEHGAAGRHEIAAVTGIHSSLTLSRYKSVWRDYINYCRGEGGYGKDPRTYPPESVTDYMMNRIDAGCSENSLQSIGSALGKWAAACDRAYGGDRFTTWAKPIAAARALGRAVCPRLDTETRAFRDPWRVISSIGDPRARLAATIQLTTGLRSMNVCKLQLNPDGSLFVRSKAGYTCPHFKIPASISRELRALADPSGRVNLIGYKAYISQIQVACAAVGERYSGSHAFRHNYARSRFNELRQSGMSVDRAKLQVSEELFHHRTDIVDKYLR